MTFLKGFGWCFHSILSSTDVKALMVDSSRPLWRILEKLSLDISWAVLLIASEFLNVGTISSGG